MSAELTVSLYVNLLFALLTLNILLYAIFSNRLFQTWHQYDYAIKDLQSKHEALTKRLGFLPLTLVRPQGGGSYIIDKGGIAPFLTPAGEIQIAKEIPGQLVRKFLLFPPVLSIEPWEFPKLPLSKIRKRLISFIGESEKQDDEGQDVREYFSLIAFAISLILRAKNYRQARNNSLVAITISALLTIGVIVFAIHLSVG